MNFLYCGLITTAVLSRTLRMAESAEVLTQQQLEGCQPKSFVGDPQES